MKTLSTSISHGGTQGVYSHASTSTNTDMTFSVFMPDRSKNNKGSFPVLWYLSGLTCSHANVTEKGEYRAACAEHGIIFIAPDTSPRGEEVANDEAYDMGQGAGFYVNSTQEPWAEHFQMRDYIETELPALIAKEFPQADMTRQAIMGHSMGGHGALTIGLRNSGRFKSISAFSPIVASTDCPWGEKALGGYLGDNRATWRDYDACALIEDGARADHILIDQGTADDFLEGQLKPHLFEQACAKAGQAVTIRMQEGYDHSYYFISTFMAEHVTWHAKRLVT
ncbi:MAG: S-formylglutathione hydrolase [Litorimonas sp.]